MQEMQSRGCISKKRNLKAKAIEYKGGSVKDVVIQNTSGRLSFTT